MRSESVAVGAAMLAMVRTIELKREIMGSVLMMMVMKMAIVAIVVTVGTNSIMV